MASGEKLAITAIRDMSQEGFIAASLKRSGWRVIYRATAVAALKQKLSEYPTALLITSDDFGDSGEIHHGSTIQLRGRSHPRKSASTLDPQSDFELAEIIRAQESNTHSIHIAATTAKVISISSVGGRTGATTLAITIAEQIAQLGSRVLLVEGNRIYPKIARHFQIHDIRGQILRSEYGFSICEATNLQGLGLLAGEADNFESIIVDLGPHSLAIDGGQRIEDLLSAWATNSQAKQIITARDGEFSSHEFPRLFNQGRGALNMGEITVFLALSKNLSRRERQKLINEREASYGTTVDIQSRDLRSIEKMEKSHSTLHVTAPQSLVIGDIARYLERERYS